MTDFETKTPRVGSVMDEARRRYGYMRRRGLNANFNKIALDDVVRLANQLEIELNQASEKIAELQKAHERYEKVRRLTPSAFSDLWNENLHTGTAFDVLVDGLR